MLRAAGLSPQQDVPAAKLGFWRVGGPVDLFVEVPDVAGLQTILATGAPVSVIGNGSNLLVADAGIRGITVRLVGDFRQSEIDPSTGAVVAGAGLLNTVLLARLGKAGLAGLGCLAGVPGTVGGAIRMNAGTSLGWIGDVTSRVEVLSADGTLLELQPAQLDFRYRRATLPTGAIVTRAWLRAETTDIAARKAEVLEHLGRRKATQPLSQPSCGSVFKNPPGDHAGRLIEQVGLKGARFGGAQISDKHANFIVNLGGAKACDIYRLIRLARDKVADQTGIMLETEVHPAGDWPDSWWPLPPPVDVY